MSPAGAIRDVCKRIERELQTEAVKRRERGGQRERARAREREKESERKAHRGIDTLTRTRASCARERACVHARTHTHKHKDESGGMICSTKVVGGRAAPAGRPNLFEDTLLLENIHSL